MMKLLQMMRLIILILLSGIALRISAQKGFDPDPAIDVINYEFCIGLSDYSDRITAEATVQIKFIGETDAVKLDLDQQDKQGRGMIVEDVLLNGKTTRWYHTEDKLIIEPEYTFGKGTECTITIDYSGIPADGLIISRNKFGSRTFFADHWPDRASGYIPVADHPSDKATVEYKITAPSHYTVVASGTSSGTQDLPGEVRITKWKEDIPIPVKVMTFGAADFAVEQAGASGNIPVWTYVYEQNREAGFSDYSIALKPLEFYSKLIGPYPFSKLANVQSKTIFGGLENAGCIFYHENSVTGQGKAEGLIAHEIAHQWFGNSVTERDWHHIWISEGFATYLTSVYFEKNYGNDKFISDLISAKNRILRYSLKEKRPLVDTTVTDLMKLLNANSYQKGAWVLHMLRLKLGDEKFWEGIRLFYERFRGANVLTSDFKKIMEETGNCDLERFFYQWCYIPGEPELKIDLIAGSKQGMSELVIEQKQEDLFEFDIEIEFTWTGNRITRNFSIDERKEKFMLRIPPGAEIKSDPGIKLLYKNLNDQ